MSGKHVASFYRFTELTNIETLKEEFGSHLQELGIVGTLTFAREGINGTLAHDSRQSLETAISTLRQTHGLHDLEANWSRANASNEVFHRLKVRTKREIVHFGSTISSKSPRGKRISPNQWDELISQEETIVLDVRNTYESEVGTFQAAIPTDTSSFREFTEFVRNQFEDQKHRPIAMFCTGGIRCEKASKWMLEHGFENVNQLDGGILNYLARTSPEKSSWVGECFVFDQRVTLNHDLEQGNYQQCFACRRPLSAQDLESEHYIPSVSCPRCHDNTTKAQKERFQERSKQVKLAKSRGRKHIGLDTAVTQES